MVIVLVFEHSIFSTLDRITLRSKRNMDKEKLISLVFVREAIWNKENKNHHNSIILKKLWSEIAVESGFPADNAKAHWKRLRQTFLKKLGDDESNISEWPYFNSLLFLKDTCMPRETSDNFLAQEEMVYLMPDDLIKTEDTLTSDVKMSSQISSTPTSRPGTPPSSPTLLEKPSKIRKATSQQSIGDPFITTETEQLEYLRRKEEDRQKREILEEERASQRQMVDEDEAFFNSILPHVRTLDPKTKINFRINVLQLLNDVLPTPSTSSN
ncbi:uncharacterized protein [Diabrotica undecimpunctata]|uniref:uncharacterized protein n=1 Tax=Diabrotica undecimpunctata TaxID=50387 RepID=UPI003B641B83